MSLNPYAVVLGDGDPVEVIVSTPDTLQVLLGKLSADKIEMRPAPGKWSVREIMAHLADCELAFGFRLRQAAAGVEMIQPFEQDDWARNYGGYDFETAMATFRALRAWNLAFIHSLTAEQRSREVTHPERGTMTFRNVVETMGGHDVNHLGQLQSVLQSKA